jgi:biotin carboxyl carrier protein
VKESNPNFIQLSIDDTCHKFTISANKDMVYNVGIKGNTYKIIREDDLCIPDFFEAAIVGQAGDFIKSPMPGKVIKILSSPGKMVKKGEVLLVVEAMKMENNLIAPRDGIVAQLNAAEGDMVDGSKILLKLESENR